MKSTRYLYLLSICCVCSFFCAKSIHAQKIPLTIDGAQFHYDDSHSIWEMYYSYADTSIKYITTTNGRYLGSLYFYVEITSQEKGVVAKAEWIADNLVRNKLTNYSKNLVGQKTFVLLQGQYSVAISIHDVNDTTHFSERIFPLVVKGFSKNRIALSDVEIATSIEPHKNNTSTKSIFFKNSLIVVPNPSHECIGTSPTLSIYSEIYNAKTINSDSLEVEYKIIDGANREQFRVVTSKRVEGNSQLEYVTIPLDALSSGVYFVDITVKSLQNSADTATVRKKIYVLNPEMPAELQRTFSEDEQFQVSEFATISPERLEEEFTKLKVLATRAEENLYESLTEPVAKQKFIFRFWKARDPIVETPQNERLEEFRKAINHANIYYSNILIKDGWRTDPGRILRKYGFPTQIDRHTASSEARPYEEWLYGNIQGGVVFQFVDLKGIGNYVQVNSSAYGERRNDNWLQQYVMLFQIQDDQIR